MRFGTTIAVMVLATGVIYGAAATVVKPPAGQSKLDEPGPPLTTRPKAPVSAVPWKQAELLPQHALLKGLVGHWTTAVHVYEGDIPKTRNAEGTADGKLLLNGLFVQLTQTETRAKQPYEGIKTFGYSEALSKYTADAIDTSRTSSIHFVGTYDAAKKTLTMSTHYTDEKLKGLRVAKSVITFIDDKTWTYEEFVSYSVGGPEVPVVAVMYKKA
jgi:uncharacterized protein DUF1579